jgi:hypothetical protein
VGWETPLTGTYSISSISHSTKAPSRRSLAATDPLAAKRTKRTPNATEGKGTYHSVEDADDGGDKYDDEDDIIPATDGPIVVTDQDIASDLFIAEKAAELVEKHHQELVLKCAGPRRTLTISSISSRIGAWVPILRIWTLALRGIVFPSFEKPTTMVPSMSSSMSLMRYLFLDPTRLAQYSDGMRMALLAGLLCPENRYFIALMSGRLLGAALIKI